MGILDNEILNNIWEAIKRNVVSVYFFVAAVLYEELLVRVTGGSFFGLGFFRTIFFSVAWGLALYLLIRLIPRQKIRTIVGIVVLSLNAVLTSIQICCKHLFKTYYNIGFMKTMTGDLVTKFGGTIVSTIFKNIIVIILTFVPLVAFILLRNKLWRRYRGHRAQKNRIIRAIIIMVVAQLIGFLVSNFGFAKADYRYDFSANNAIPEFGEMTAVRLELEYAIFGMPKKPLASLDLEEEETVNSSLPESNDPNSYEYNELDIDWDAVMSRCTDETTQALTQYYSSKTASRKNDYTGYFEGKNLILITAEAFCPYCISEEYTPTLYKLTHEGFVFTDYYQPDWGQSTIGGEFASLSGLIPSWHKGELTADCSSRDYMPFVLGQQFSSLGYTTVAYHNYFYDFYNRANIHPNLGYDYKGIGNGLDIPSGDEWPPSDLEMWQATMPQLISDYKNNGKPFHAYFMTVSMHGGYDDWSENSMSYKNKELAQQYWPDASTPVQVYMASALETEAGLTYLINALEEAGIADDTVIALTADHYPFFLSESSDGKDHYNELRGMTDTIDDASRYLNSFILWCGGMEEPITVDTPCCAVDILPTLSNLFNLKFDSRLLSGHDIMATTADKTKASSSMPLVILPGSHGNSWVTEAGYYDCVKNKFTANPGITVEDGYVTTVCRMCEAQTDYAAYLLGLDYYRIVFPDGIGAVQAKTGTAEEKGSADVTLPEEMTEDDYGGDSYDDEEYYDDEYYDDEEYYDEEYYDDSYDEDY